MFFKDHFSGNAEAYAAYRPTYPYELYQYILDYVNHNEVAWDCATGNGQAAVALSPYFQRIIATDASTNQIERAQRRDNVDYRVVLAEQPGIRSQTIDLITVAQAAHWFDLDKFYREVNHVAKPGAIIALWCYGLAQISPEIDEIIFKLYNEILGEYWPTERKYVENQYQDLPFPFKTIPSPDFTIENNWSVDLFKNYLCTWSSSQNYHKMNQVNPLDLISKDLDESWSAGDIKIVKWSIYLKLGFIPSS